MHYAISTKVLGQTHIWYTQHKWSKVLEIFQILWVFEFFVHTQKQDKKSKINKNKKYKTKLVKKTCYKLEAMTQDDYVCHDARTHDPKHRKY